MNISGQSTMSQGGLGQQQFAAGIDSGPQTVATLSDETRQSVDGALSIARDILVRLRGQHLETVGNEKTPAGSLVSSLMELKSASMDLYSALNEISSLL